MLTVDLILGATLRRVWNAPDKNGGPWDLPGKVLGVLKTRFEVEDVQKYVS